MLVLLTVALAACGRGSITDGVSDSAFVSTMAELERIERAPGLDSAARMAARTATLQRQGLTRAKLEAAATALGDDPRRALAIWRAIDAKVGADSTAHVGPGIKPALDPAGPPVGAPPAGVATPAAAAPTSTGRPAIRRR